VVLPDDSAVTADTASDMVVFPEHRLAYYPVTHSGREAPASLFAAADKLELQESDYGRALAALRAQVQSKEPAVRAAALMRVARIYRKQNLRAEALSAYREMLDLKAVRVEGRMVKKLIRPQIWHHVEFE
jgi:hypothetical protein